MRGAAIGGGRYGRRNGATAGNHATGREFRNDVGRRGLVVSFDMLGAEYALTVRHRPLLVSALN